MIHIPMFAWIPIIMDPEYVDYWYNPDDDDLHDLVTKNEALCKIAERKHNVYTKMKTELATLRAINRASKQELAELKTQIARLKAQLEKMDIPAAVVSLEEARQNMGEAAQRLGKGDESAESEVERWDKVVRMHPDHEKEQLEMQRKWDAEQRESNEDALRRMRRLLPPDIATRSPKEMQDLGMAKKCANRLTSQRALRLIVTHPEESVKMHIADLSMCTNQGLDIVEMRAVYAMLPEKFDLDGDGKKAKWRDNFVQKLKELVAKQQSKQLRCNELRDHRYKDAEEELARRSQTGEQDFFFDPSLPLTRRKVAKSTAFKTRASSEKEKHAKAAAKAERQNPFTAMQAEMARKATARAKRNAPQG